MNLKQIWASIVAWWISWTARWRKPQPTSTVLEVIPEPLAVEPEPPEVPTLEEFEVAAVEPPVIEPEIVEEPQPSELSRKVEQFLALLMARELRAHRHYNATGSCNEHVPSVDSRAAGPLQDCRVNRPTNSRTHRTS